LSNYKSILSVAWRKAVWGSLGDVKPRGAVRGEGALRVYCSKQLRKSHLEPLDGEGACDGIWSCTGSRTWRVVFSSLASIPSTWWLEVVLMTTVRSGTSALHARVIPSHPYTPRDSTRPLPPTTLRIASQTASPTTSSACNRIHHHRSHPI
jgi:hypothetical protein